MVVQVLTVMLQVITQIHISYCDFEMITTVYTFCNSTNNANLSYIE
jgi:hypothetical protein